MCPEVLFPRPSVLYVYCECVTHVMVLPLLSLHKSNNYTAAVSAGIFSHNVKFIMVLPSLSLHKSKNHTV